jgi:hypothetical protein
MAKGAYVDIITPVLLILQILLIFFKILANLMGGTRSIIENSSSLGSSFRRIFSY